MTVSFQVRWDEGPLRVGSASGRGELNYVATSDDPANDDRDEVINGLLAIAPANLYGLVLDQAGVEERISDNANEAQWDCTVTYTNSQRKQPFTLTYPVGSPDPRPVRISIRSATNASLNRTQSEEFIGESALFGYSFAKVGDGFLKKYVGFESAPPEDAATQYTVRGVQVPIGGVEIVVETVANYQEVNAGFLITASKAAGDNSTNNAVWQGFPKGSLKLTGFESSQRATNQSDPTANEEQWDIVYTFAYGAPQTIERPGGLPAFEDENGTAVPDLSDDTTDGWHFVDSLFVERSINVGAGDGGPDVFVSLPVLVRIAVQQIYPEIDFPTILGIPAT